MIEVLYLHAVFYSEKAVKEEIPETQLIMSLHEVEKKHFSLFPPPVDFKSVMSHHIAVSNKCVAARNINTVVVSRGSTLLKKHFTMQLHCNTCLKWA